ncbi:ectonucleotide pyrophosphatase/phosphodiesterase [Niabella terrae]
MKKICILVVVFWSLQLQAQSKKHVIMITLDGMRPEFYMSKDWHAPELKKLVDEGAHARAVTSVFPAMTFPSHTTMVTGVTPQTHGIYYNTVFTPAQTANRIYWNFKENKSLTLWEAARLKGLSTASLVWPVSADAPVDFNIPDIGGMGTEVLEKYSKPDGVTDILRREVLDGAEKINIGDDRSVAKIAAWVIRNNKPNLMSIHMFQLDHAEHDHGREAPEVEAALSRVDSCVGIIRAAIREAGIADNTLLIVLGDHGFFDYDRRLMPNVLLAKAGLLDPKNLQNWKARFNTVGGGAFLYVKNQDPKIAAQVRKLFSQLPLDQQRYFRIISKKEMQQVGADPNAVLALSAQDGVAFGGSADGKFLRIGKTKGTHGHYPLGPKIQTGLMAVGPGILPGTDLGQMHLLDIAPIVSQFLQLDMGGDLKGKVPQNLFHRK